MSNKTAHHLKTFKGPKSGQVRKLYRLDPPLEDADVTRRYVVVSAVDVPYSGEETCIFASDEAGKVVSYRELEGSFRGALDHERALHIAGYEVA